ncbi:MAG: hypothetical protein ACXVZJ_13890 [Terriglobales bacterium]
MDIAAVQQAESRTRARIVTAAIAGAIVLTLALLWAANRAGWIPHHQDTTVYVGVSEWSVGDVRNCVALPETNGSMIFLGCVGERRAEMSPDIWRVTYWGQTRRRDMYRLIHENPGNYAWRWRCRRSQDSLTCWAVN